MNEITQTQTTAANIINFSNEQLGSIRTLLIDGEPWFVGKDVATILGYRNPNEAILEHIDTEDKLHSKTLSSFELNSKTIPSFGQRGGWFINESGMYSLILSSKLPSAKQFKRWVTSEVLPTIRRTGSYIIQQKPDSYMIENPTARAKRWVEEYEEKQQLQLQLTEQQPLVNFADTVQQSEDVISMNTMAKLATDNGMTIGRNKLFEFLREHKVLMDDNQPYQRYMNQQRFEVAESHVLAYDGVRLVLTTLVKPKGQIGIINLLKKKGYAVAV